MSSPAKQTQSPPIENFLATVLYHVIKMCDQCFPCITPALL